MIKTEQDNSSRKFRADQLSRRFDLPLESDFQINPDLRLGWHDDKLALLPISSGPVFVDFVEGTLAHRRQFGGGKKQPLARAVGLSGKFTPDVIDATAGLGRDSFVMASLGCRVQMIEQSPIVAAALADGLLRAVEHESLKAVMERMSLVCADSVDYLSTHGKVDVIYLDPMYPEKRKSAAVKKDMRVLQQLIGSEGDNKLLLEVALEQAVHRVVVKRPRNAKPLANRSAGTTISSPNTRYDIYVLRSFSAHKTKNS